MNFWENNINPITGFKTVSRLQIREKNKTDQKKYSNVYPTLKIKTL